MTEMSPSLSPSGVKNGDRTCSGLRGRATGHVIACHWFIFPFSHAQIPAYHLSVLACSDATSCEHQSSSLHPKLVFTVLDYRCQQQNDTAIGTEKLRDIWHAAYYGKRSNPRHIVFRCRVAWRWSGLGIPCFSRMYFSVWTHAHYSNTSSPIRPYRSHRRKRELI